MRLSARLALPLLVLLSTLVEAQDGGFQLPVQLIGFPVIIMAVRLSNFMKKLAYAVSPRTYVRRTRRAAAKSALSALSEEGATPDPATVEKLLLSEFGARVCVYERVCAQYAQRALNAHGHNALLDWDTVFSRYKSAPAGEKQNYLLSVFLGDMVRSPSLCMALAKRGRSCSDMEAAERSINHLHDHSTTTAIPTTARPHPRRSKPSRTRVPHHPESQWTRAHQQPAAPVVPAPLHRQPSHPRSPASRRRPDDHHQQELQHQQDQHHQDHHHQDQHHQDQHHQDQHHQDQHHVLRTADHPAQHARRTRPGRRRLDAQSDA